MPAGLLPAWTLNNHDAQRAVTRFGRADAETHGAGHGGAVEVAFGALGVLLAKDVKANLLPGKGLFGAEARVGLVHRGALDWTGRLVGGRLDGARKA